MAINATKKGGNDIPQLESGAYPARIFSVIHVGTVVGYQGQLQNKARITFELPTETYVFKEEKGAEPRVISAEYTLSFHERASLRKVMDACLDLKLDDEGLIEFDITNLIGKTCLITLKTKQKSNGDGNFTYVDSATKLPKGMEVSPQYNATQILDYDNWNQEMFDKLPTFLQDKIKTSSEYIAMKAGDKDAIPFD